MEDFFDNVVDAGVTRAILLQQATKDTLSTKQSTLAFETRRVTLFKTEQKGQSFLHDDGKITFMEVAMTAKLLLSLTRKTEDAAQARS